MTSWMLLLHVLGIVMWVGGLLVTTQVLMQHAQEPSKEAWEALAGVEAMLRKGMSNPGAVLTVLSGAALIALNPSYYLHARWLHVKLAFVVLLLVLHWVTVARGKAFHAGQVALTRADWLRVHIFIAFCFLSILVCVLPLAVYWH
jgi:putative membrane protein